MPANNGFIHGYSEPDKGTICRSYLPRVTEASATVYATATRAPMLRGHGETILLVEDEESVRKMCQLFLEGSGFTVISAASPAQALEIGNEPERRFDLLLTDVIMPGMDGRQLARQLAETQPAMKVLFMSGYPAEILAPRGLLTQETAFLSKPFARNELIQKVWAVLN